MAKIYVERVEIFVDNEGTSSPFAFCDALSRLLAVDSTACSGTRDYFGSEMSGNSAVLENTGLDVIDVRVDREFRARRLHVRDWASQSEGLRALAHAFVERPETLLQELVEAAVTLCEADSAGISLERENRTDAEFYEWVATAGQYSGFLNAVLPRHPSACGLCLERGAAQVFRVGQRFFDLLGVEAPLVTDGLLLPWETEDTRGTIFVMAHGRTEAFDAEDCRLLETLADFAAMAVRQRKQQQKLLDQAKAAAAARMANELAHQINNPLQSLVNTMYLASEGHSDVDARELGQATMPDLNRLSALVKSLLVLQVGPAE